MNAKELGQQSVSAYSRMRDDNDTIGGAMHGMKFDRCDGLTKRELFAAMALQAFIPTIDGARNTGVRDIAEKTIVASVAAADMLLAELAKGQP